MSVLVPPGVPPGGSPGVPPGVPPTVPVADGPEALIKEARRRTRRRRVRAAIGAAVLVAAAGLAFVAGSGGGAGVVAETAGRPFVDVRAFSREGELAFISRGALWVLDGTAGSLRKVASTTYTAQAVANASWNTQVSLSTPVAPTGPTLSHDGRWLAYLVTVQSDGDGSPSQLWLANGDGSGAHEVAGVGVDGLVGWSPTADVLAVIADANGRPQAVDLVSAHGAVRRLLALPASATAPTWLEGAVWSPSGGELAVSVDNPRPGVSGTVTAYPVGAGRPATWFSIRADQHLPDVYGGGCGEVIAPLAGWWPRWGIGFWAIACGASRNLDETPLEVLSAPGVRPRLIAQTLSEGGTDPVAAGRGGGLAVVATTSAGRVYSQGKAVEACTRGTLSCTALPDDTVWLGRTPKLPCLGGSCGPFRSPAPGTPGSAVSLEPAWSPNGSELAYVLAPTTPSGLATPVWYAAHELFVWSPRTGASTKLAGPSGASAPAWSRNGRDLLYVSGDGLWLAPAAGGKPVEIARPLFPEKIWKAQPTSISFNGQIDWTGQFSWWSP